MSFPDQNIAAPIADALEAANVIVEAECAGKISHVDAKRIQRKTPTDLQDYTLTKAIDWLIAHRSIIRQKKGPQCSHGVLLRRFDCVECAA